MISKFSKPSGPLISAKQSFFSSNDELLRKQIEIGKVYTKQPARVRCKNCETKLGEHDFMSHGIAYCICRNCTQLNGTHEDSNEFVRHLYSDDGGDNYKASYLGQYDQRVADIYRPKVDFLLDVMEECGESSGWDVLDLGCGAGHFVKACELAGIKAKGYDPSEALTSLGKEKLVSNQVHKCEITQFESILSESHATVTSMIGVLEHLQRPRDAVAAFKRSHSRYLYLDVPLFSFSALLEHISPDVFPRQLSGGHTHLYTKESLEYLLREFNLEVRGEWWFGTDMVDLFRTLLVKSKTHDASSLPTAIQNLFGKHIDDLQSTLDKQRVCSEVHLILTKK